MPALGHTVPLMLDSPYSRTLCMPGLLSWVVTVIRGSEYEASDVVPGPGPNIRHPLSVFPSLHRVPRDQFPGFIGTLRVLRLPAVHPAALRCLRLAVPRWHSRDFAPRRPSAPSRPGVGHPVTPAGNLRGDDRISQVPGESRLPVCACSYRRRQDCSHQTITVQQRGPRTPGCRGSHERSFDAQ